MKRRLLTVAAFATGTLLFLLLLPRFEAPQPHGLRVTRGEARELADAAARRLGIAVGDAWTVLSWEPAPILEEQYRHDPELRRRAVEDPAVGPRLAGLRATYYRRNLVFDYLAAGHPAASADSEGTPLIAWCAYHGDLSAIRYLLSHGESLESFGENFGLDGAGWSGIDPHALGRPRVGKAE
ncbi:MAG TPA: hypothetical protein VMS56_02320 [Thermoanaerobaculia bacterium]|nr:hypothetical protein [Thermoanaerobaculia bacterium]